MILSNAYFNLVWFQFIRLRIWCVVFQQICVLVQFLMPPLFYSDTFRSVTYFQEDFIWKCQNLKCKCILILPPESPITEFSLAYYFCIPFIQIAKDSLLLVQQQKLVILFQQTAVFMWTVCKIDDVWESNLIYLYVVWI